MVLCWSTSAAMTYTLYLFEEREGMHFLIHIYFLCTVRQVMQDYSVRSENGIFLNLKKENP